MIFIAENKLFAPKQVNGKNGFNIFSDEFSKHDAQQNATL